LLSDEAKKVKQNIIKQKIKFLVFTNKVYLNISFVMKDMVKLSL